MVNKKYLMLAGLFTALAGSPAIAQESESTQSASWSSRDMTYRGDNYDVLDSNYYPKRKMGQYRKYMNHQNIFPPRPRDMWEIGINGGLLNVIGDVTTKTPLSKNNVWKATDAMAWGVTVRKSLGYTGSLRLRFLHGRASGIDYRSAAPTNVEYSRIGYAPGTFVYNNYRTTYTELGLEYVIAFNNIRFHQGKSWVNPYAFAGLGIATYAVKVSRYKNRATKQLYNFGVGAGNGNIPQYGRAAEWADRAEIYSALKNYMNVESDNLEYMRPESETRLNKDVNITPVIAVGLGSQFRLSKRVSLSIEERVTFTGRDKLDATNVGNTGATTPDKDLVNYLNVGLQFNLGNSSRRVAPLWWVNPLDHAYSELSSPRHMKLPDPVLADDDNDGIANQFDKCPGTPAGVAVDSHGCPLDTDGDGVPDYKDKQLITPTECQPVDADGVGKCPYCPEGNCGSTPNACGSIASGTLTFTGTASRISPAMQAQLSTLAAQMKANPTCKVVIVGMGNVNKKQQQRSWDRVNSVIEYMSEKQLIERNRFIFQYGQSGDANGVMYRSAVAGEEGRDNVPPPFPNLRDKK